MAEFTITLVERTAIDGRIGITASVFRNDTLVSTHTQSQDNERYSRHLCAKAAFYRMLDDGVFDDEAPF